MNENEFELDGKVYVTRRETDNCHGCYFKNISCARTPPCCSESRNDGRNVIFVEKQP